MRWGFFLSVKQLQILSAGSFVEFLLKMQDKEVDQVVLGTKKIQKIKTRLR